MGNLLNELKRRKVFRIAGAYAVVGWVLAQVAQFAVDTFAAPQWVQQIFVVFLILGFPIALLLAWAYEVTPEGIKSDSGIQASAQVPASQGQRFIYATFVLVLLAVGFQFADRFLLQSQPNEITGEDFNLIRRFEINLGVTVPTSGGLRNAEVVLSPDGKRLVFGLQRPDSPQQIYVQELDQLKAQRISGADGGDHPFFSPDGDWIVYTDVDSLKKISIRDGEAITVANSSRRGGSGFWTNDDTIYFASDDANGLQLNRVSANGGSPEALQIDPQFQNYEHSWPWLLPDEESLIFTISPLSRARDGQIALLSLSSGDVRIIIQSGYNARYVPSGHIVFVRAASLWAVPFDIDKLETTGPEVPVIQGVQTAGHSGGAAYTFSDDGLLVYLPGVDTTDVSDTLRTLLWVDRDGNEESLPLRRDFRVPVVSPDGQRLAVVVRENGNDDIAIYDLARNTLSRLTFDDASDYDPLWSPDGERIVFRSDRGDGGLWLRAADGTGLAEPLMTGNSSIFPNSFTSDGSQLVYELGGDLYLLNLDSESTPQRLTQTAVRERRASISHDGRWIAYDSNETGRYEVYVRPFPNLEAGKWQISSGGGSYATWNLNDTELFFRSNVVINSPQVNVLSSQVNTETTFQYNAPRTVFEGTYEVSGRVGAFDISADGSQFLLMRGAGPSRVSEQTRLVVVENWFEELKRLAPRDPM